MKENTNYAMNGDATSRSSTKSIRFEADTSSLSIESFNRRLDDDESTTENEASDTDHFEIHKRLPFRQREWSFELAGAMKSFIKTIDREFKFSVHEDDEEEEDIDTIFAGDDRRLSVNSTFSNTAVHHHMHEIDVQIEEIKAWIKQVHQIHKFLRKTDTTITSKVLGKFRASSINIDGIPVDVGITSIFEESLRKLSTSLKYMFTENRPSANELVETVAKIPKLIKTIVLIEDEDDRERVMDYPIIKRVMLCKYSLIEITNVESQGQLLFESWITEFLESRSFFYQKKVVDYLENISRMTHKDFSFDEDSSSSSRAPSTRHLSHNRATRSVTATIEDINEFKKQQHRLFETVRAMKSFMPSLLLLNQEERERASMTNLVRNVLNWQLSRPFGVTVVLFDLLSQITMLIVFRPQLNITLDQRLGGGHYGTTEWLSSLVGLSNRGVGYAILTLLTGVTLFYRIFRRVVYDLSICSTSRSVYATRFLNFWNLVDFTTVGLYSFCVFVQFSGKFENYTGYTETLMRFFNIFGITIGFLWLSFLSLLKIMNQSFATFVVAISHIIQDVFLFLIVMLIIILACGDMLHVIFAANPAECPDNFENSSKFRNSEFQLLHDSIVDPNPFCETRATSLLAVYRVFVGDFSIEDFEGSSITILIYCFLTFFGIIILLNVLIALVCESYQKSQSKAERLFGGARIAYVAELVAFEGLLLPRQPDDDSSWISYWCSVGGLSRIVIYLCCIGSLFGMLFLLLIVSALLFEVFMDNGRNQGWSIFLSILIISPALHVWMIFLTFFYTGLEDRDQDKHSPIHKFQRNPFFKFCFAVPMIYVTRLLLGTITWRGKSVSGCIQTPKNDEKEENDRVLETQIQPQLTELNGRLGNMEHKFDEFEKRAKIDELRAAADRKDEIEMMEERIKDEMKMMEKRIMYSIERAFAQSQFS